MQQKKTSHFFCSGEDGTITGSQIHRRIEVGRDLRRSLFQLLAQSTGSSEVSPDCSGLFPDRS